MDAMGEHSTRKEVYFHEYCDKCQHLNLEEDKDPCHECLHYGWNINSHKPVNFKPGNSHC